MLELSIRTNTEAIAQHSYNQCQAPEVYAEAYQQCRKDQHLAMTII